MMVFHGSSYGLPLISALLLVCILILIIFDLRLRHKIKHDLKTMLTKENISHSNLGEQILTVLIRHDGKMNPFEISYYLDMPVELIVQKLRAMEQDRLVLRKGLSEDYEIRFKKYESK
jgi:hypothetical protein